ncbi:MAG: sugar transferase [Flavobacteriales bacterium]|nr:sugar transferase [Flavobacteriales bacterium]
MSLKRLFDLAFALVCFFLIFPFLFLISIWIILDSRGGVFYSQQRIGKNGIPFQLMKFRTMRPDSHKKGLLTIGFHDQRITRAGRWLRKYKMDEWPQLLNIIAGDMSFVGPRPEVKKYVDLYTEEQRKVLTVQPGLTDYASIEYFDENEVLARSDNPEQTYISEVMPRKLALNMKYISEKGMATDIKIIWKTFLRILQG